MTHIEETTKPVEHTAGKLSVGMVSVYVVLFSLWLLVQLRK
jgi:hypothetical protein